MKILRTTLLLSACLAVPAAFAQWLWIDKDGRKVFSDQAPPPSVPADKILRRAGRAAAPEPAAAVASPAASMPKVSGKDKELEDRRKQAAAAEADRKKAQEDELAKARAENCVRARQAKATLDSGIRLMTTNSQGEREYLDDDARAAEAKRLDGIVAHDCKGAS